MTPKTKQLTQLTPCEHCCLAFQLPAVKRDGQVHQRSRWHDNNVEQSACHENRYPENYNIIDNWLDWFSQRGNSFGRGRLTCLISLSFVNTENIFSKFFVFLLCSKHHCLTYWRITVWKSFSCSLIKQSYSDNTGLYSNQIYTWYRVWREKSPQDVPGCSESENSISFYKSVIMLSLFPLMNIYNWWTRFNALQTPRTKQRGWMTVHLQSKYSTQTDCLVCKDRIYASNDKFTSWQHTVAQACSFG